MSVGIVVPMLSVVGRLRLTVVGTKSWVWVLLWVWVERVNRAGSLTAFILSAHDCGCDWSPHVPLFTLQQQWTMVRIVSQTDPISPLN